MHLEQLKVWQRHKHLVVAVVEDEAGAIAAVKRLQRLGIPNDHISLMGLDVGRVHDVIESIGPRQGQLVHGGQAVDALAEQASPKGRDEAAGMAVGGCVGLVLGLGVFAIPGLGATLLAAGPLIMAINVLGHTAAGGIGMGMLLGAIFDERVTEEHRAYYEAQLKAGRWLLVVEGEESLMTQAQQEINLERVVRVETF